MAFADPCVDKGHKASPRPIALEHRRSLRVLSHTRYPLTTSTAVDCEGTLSLLPAFCGLFRAGNSAGVRLVLTGLVIVAVITAAGGQKAAR